MNMNIRIRDIVGMCFMRFCRIVPVDRKKIVFKCFRGLYHNDNPGAIFEEMKKEHQDYHYVWIMKNPEDKIEGARVVREGSLREIYELATAKVWIDNKRKGNWVRKRKEQYYVQTWHGGIALKKIENDARDSLPEYYLESARRDSELADLFLSGSMWQTDNYRSAFFYKHEILEKGLPRMDALFGDTEGRRKKANQYFHLAEKDRIILYAPTFREGIGFECSREGLEKIMESFESTFAGNWKMIIRMHANAQSSGTKIIYDHRILNGTDYPDINDLILASEFLITDYSSCMFDAMTIKKKVLLYIPDEEEYRKDRGLYFEFEDLPFLYAHTIKELKCNIETFSLKQYEKKVDDFLSRVGDFNDGNAAESAVSYIIRNGMS